MGSENHLPLNKMLCRDLLYLLILSLVEVEI